MNLEEKANESIHDCIKIGYECIVIELVEGINLSNVPITLGIIKAEDTEKAKSFYKKIAVLALEISEKYGIIPTMNAFNRYIF